MAGLSDIEWTDATWNPVTGCTMVSTGCTNCYAMRMAARLQAMHHPSYDEVTRKSGGRHVWTGNVHLNWAALETPLGWRKSRMIFVNSMSDLFQESVPFNFVAEVWEVMRRAHWHVFQILTKRPDRMQRFVGGAASDEPLRNVWLGTSVENAESVGRIDILRGIPAAVRFISFEPLIGPVGRLNLAEIHWAIVGGESGPKARAIQHEWIDQIMRSCMAHDVAFFFKQWGGRNKKTAGRMYRGRTWDAYPKVTGSSGSWERIGS